MIDNEFLPELAQHKAESGLWISSAYLNGKYTMLSSIGDVVSIAYNEAEAMKGFANMLCRTFVSGADLEASPRLNISEDLTGCGIALFVSTDFAPDAHATRIELSHIEPLDRIHEIGSRLKENGCKVAIIEDATPLCSNNPRMAMSLLNEIAARQQAMIFAFYKLHDEATALNDYLTNHVYNLCQIGRGSLNNGIMGYYYFQYGNPNPERIIYNRDGGVIANCARLLRIERVVKTFAQKWIPLSMFKQIAFGAMGGEYAKGTIEKDISVANEFGVIELSGMGNKKKLCLASGKMKCNLCKDSIALTALGNPYTSPNHIKQRKPILRMGDFRLIAPEDTYRDNVRNFAIGLMGAILKGERWLDFEVKTSYRNVLCIIVGASDEAREWMEKRVEPREAKLEILTLPHDTTDEAFMAAFNESVDNTKPDFVFIMCYDRIANNLYTEAQLVKEIASYTKSKGMACIAVSDKSIERTDYDLADDEYWSITDLVLNIWREEIKETYDWLDKKEIDLPYIYSFKGSLREYDFMCRYKQSASNDGCMKFIKASADEQLKCFLIATFYWCDNTPIDEIEEDCTGHKLTNNTIKKAVKERLIKVDRDRITFIGG